MADLSLTFEEIYNSVGRFLGWENPTDKQLRIVKDIIYRGYRQFLQPIDRRTGQKHTWSFLYKHSVLKTEADKWEYELPSDFANELLFFEHEVDTAYSKPKFRDYTEILRYRVLSESSSYPSYFSIRTGRYDKEIGQRYEVVFYGTPNGVYNLPYCYIFTPPKPDNTSDYLIGGIKATEALLECCLAVAELNEDGNIGVHNSKAEDLIQKLIISDIPLKADSVGLNLDSSIGRGDWSRYLEPLEYEYVYYADR